MNIGEQVKDFEKFINLINNYKKLKLNKSTTTLRENIHNINNKAYFVDYLIKRIKKEHLIQGNIIN